MNVWGESHSSTVSQLTRPVSSLPLFHRSKEKITYLRTLCDLRARSDSPIMGILNWRMEFFRKDCIVQLPLSLDREM